MGELIKSEIVEVDTHGCTGDSLCWAEVAASIAWLYRVVEVSSFCSFLSMLLEEECCASGSGSDCACCGVHSEVAVKCDERGYVECTLEGLGVGLGCAKADLDFMASEIRCGRPLVVVSGEDSLHAMIVAGVLCQGGVHGVEVVDPACGDFRRLYLWDWYSCLLESHFRQMVTRPSTPVCSKERLGETNWASRDLEGVSFVERPIDSPRAEIAVALATFFDASAAGAPKHLGSFDSYPLEIVSFDLRMGVCEILESGWRCFFWDRVMDQAVVVDVLRDGDSLAVARISVGAAVTDRVATLKMVAARKDSRLELSGFRELLQIGLDVAELRDEQGAGIDCGDENDGRVQWCLFGPRGYLGLPGPSVTKDTLRGAMESVDAVEYLGRLREHFSSFGPG